MVKIEVGGVFFIVLTNLMYFFYLNYNIFFTISDF